VRFGQKDHIDFADDLDLIVKPEGLASNLERPFGALLGSGIPLFSIGGGIFRKILIDILTDFHLSRGYKIVESFPIVSSELYKISGHLEFYKENMYILEIEGKEFAIKPMNCPHHILIFINLLQKYRQKIKLPFRIFEPGRVARFEPSGSLHGLFRVRQFTQDDGHIFIELKEIKKEMLRIFEDEVVNIYEKIFHIPIIDSDLKLRLSFADFSELGKYYAGKREDWEIIQDFMSGVAQEIERKYGIEYYEGVGEAVFYGPKIDGIARFGEKEWQLFTIQFDFNLPIRFKLPNLISEIFEKEIQIYMIHRAILGSIERFLGTYLEYSKGRLPFALSPLQVAVVGIKTGAKDIDRKIEMEVKGIEENFKSKKIRVASILQDKTGIASLIRKMQTTIKPPIIIFVGEKEAKEGKISIKYYDYNKKEERDERMVSLERAEKIIENMEKGIKELTGKVYRLYQDMSYLL